MTKIYNEVIIDMNPDSSTYEEILHEDSFEYDGPMALAVAGGLDRGWTSEGGAWLGKFVKDSEASHMYGGNKYWVFDTDDGYTVLVDDDGKVLSYNVPSVVDAYGDRGEWATAKLQTEAVDAPISTEEDAEGIAKTIDSSDFLQYFDPYSGGIKDKEGLTSYLKGITGKFSSDITAALDSGTLPNIMPSAQDIASQKTAFQSDVYGIRSSMMEERQKERQMAGVSGVYSPTSTGFGGGTSKAYAQLSDLAGQRQDIYGLVGEEEETALANWLQSQGLL